MEITVITDHYTAQELQEALNPGGTVMAIVMGDKQPSEYVVVVENEIKATLVVGMLKHIGVYTKFEPIYHYPNDENDGSLEPQPCTCGAKNTDDCRCNDGYLHIELDPLGRTHIWSGNEDWVHHPEWYPQQENPLHREPRVPRQSHPMGERPARPYGRPNGRDPRNNR